MPFEVELKFPTIDLASLQAELERRGATPQPSRTQVDRYFNHPSRDFAQTDEALRLRIDGDRPRITYKGPKIDADTKTRKEIELPLGENPDDLEQMSEMLVLLGFRSVATVQKVRQSFDLVINNISVEISLDNVADVGSFVELEGTAEGEQIDDVRQVILELAKELGLKSPERRSYLELLLARPGS